MRVGLQEFSRLKGVTAYMRVEDFVLIHALYMLLLIKVLVDSFGCVASLRMCDMCDLGLGGGGGGGDARS
jgi:hypothetical protein